MIFWLKIQPSGVQRYYKNGGSRIKVGVPTPGNIPSKFDNSFNVMNATQGNAQLGHKVDVITLLDCRTLRNRIIIKDMA